MEGTMDMQNIQNQLDDVKAQLETLKNGAAENKVSMVVFSGDMDKVLASLVIATGSVAMGMDVVMFFTFWGTPVLRDKNKKVGGKEIKKKMLNIQFLVVVIGIVSELRLI